VHGIIPAVLGDIERELTMPPLVSMAVTVTRSLPENIVGDDETGAANKRNPDT